MAYIVGEFAIEITRERKKYYCLATSTNKKTYFHLKQTILAVIGVIELMNIINNTK